MIIESTPQPAPLLRRFGAILYDLLLIVALWMITLFILVAVNGGAAVYGAPLQTLLFLELFIFYAYYWRSGGQTLGMLAWKIRLETDTGGPMQLRQVLLRLFGAALGLGCLGIGYWWMLFHPSHKTWADSFSDTQLWFVP